MIRKQISQSGKIIDAGTEILSQSRLKEISNELFSQNNWQVTEFSQNQNAGSIRVSLQHSKNEDAQYHFNFYYANIRDEKRNVYEKKIQLGSKDPRQLNKQETIILGMYVIDKDASLEDVIFVGYPIDDNINYNTNPSIRKTFVDDILLKTRLKGIYVDADTKYVGFTKEYIFYYLDNFKKIHGYTEEEVDKTKAKPVTNNIVTEPYQRIFFGAPGTGKSYKLNIESIDNFGENYERVTFHPNYMYGNFVGVYKPYPKTLKTKDGNIKVDYDGNIEETITYEFVGGPLLRQLIKAFKNPEKPYLVLIEEINRANVSAVFGDIFQLLDRDRNGESEYPITTSKELRDYLKREFVDFEISEPIKNKLGKNFERLFFPSNFYLWATMNSADQGVMPVDTAFKRRWEFNYLGIDAAALENKSDFDKYKFKSSSNELIKWDDFRRAVNKRLSVLNIPEDKLVGPFFISKSILESGDIDKLTDTVKNKVLMYLYEDAGKPVRNLLFADGKHGTYSIVCENFEEDLLSLFKGGLNIETELIEK